MARNDNRRVNSRSGKMERYYYEGNTVRKLQAIPEEEPEREQQRKRVSTRTSRNRSRATMVNGGYVLFLAIVSVATLFICVHYLRLKSDVTAQTKVIASKESTLSELKADNDALYNTVLASEDLEYIKDVAMNQLGMQYPGEDQLYEFNTAGNSYVRQYKDVPGSD